MLLQKMEKQTGLNCCCNLMNVTSIPLHMHSDAFEVVFVLKGAIRLRCTSFQYNLTEGDVFIININELHSLFGMEEENLVLTFQFDPYKFLNIFPRLSYYWFVCESYHDASKNSPHLIQLQRMLLNLAKVLEQSPLRSTNDIDTLVVNMINHLMNYYQNFSFSGSDFVKQNSNIGDSLASERIFQIQEYIYLNYKNKITLDEISDYIYLSKYYISHLIKHMTGLNLTSLIGLIRVEKSEILLLTTKMSLEQIAFECGFSTAQYFKKHFIRWNKVDPQEYRQTSLAEIARTKLEVERLSYNDGRLKTVIHSFLPYEAENIPVVTERTFKIDLNGDYTPFPHHWEQYLNISDANIYLQRSRTFSITQCKADLHFHTVKLGNLFEANTQFNGKNDYFNNGLFHLLDNIHDAGLNIIFTINPENESVDELAKSASALLELLGNQYDGIDIAGKWELHIIEFSSHKTNKKTEDLFNELRDILKRLGLEISLKTVCQEASKIPYAYNTMHLIPHIIQHTLDPGSGFAAPYRELFDIEKESSSSKNPVVLCNGLYDALGEKKSIYHAWYLLSLLGEQKYVQENGMIVTRKGDAYYVLIYDSINISGELTNISSPPEMTFTLHLASKKSKNFRATQISLDNDNSLFQHLKNLEFPNHMSKEDIQFINWASAPEVSFFCIDLTKSPDLKVTIKPYSAKLLILKAY